MQHDAAVVDRREARDRAQQRALAAARRAEQHEQLAVGDMDGDVADGRGVVVLLRDLFERDRHRQPRGMFDLAGPRQHGTERVPGLSVSEELRAGDISV